MPLDSDSCVAGEATLPITMRSDLVIREQYFGLRRHWVVKDPIALRYFHLLDEEYVILQMLDGQTSLGEIQRQYEQQFAPRRVRPSVLQRLFHEFYQKGFLLVDAANQDWQVGERRRQQRPQHWRKAVGGVLALRLPGLDPAPLLRWLEPYCRCLFSRAANAVWWIFVLSAMGLVAIHFDELLRRLPEFRSFFTTGNLPWVFLAMALIKVCHELAHAVTCKHFGGECHEMGVMFLLFTPCLYCDVSDAWLLPGKRQRIAISAAGIYLEVFLASVCTFLWWYTNPGFLNSMALNVVMLCSVETIVFNANPLMRFDGYYIFADYVEIPNLQARSQQALWQRLAAWGLGIDSQGDRVFSEQRGLLLTSYAVASLVYRFVVIAGIYYFLAEVLAPYRLQVLAQMFILVAVAGMLASPVWTLGKLLRAPLMRNRVKFRHAIRSMLILVGLGMTVVFVPLPCRVSVPLSLELKDAHPVYVTAAGILKGTVSDGSRVVAGDLLARLAAPETKLQVIDLTSRRDRQVQRVEHLEARRGSDAQAASQIPSARQMLADLEERLRQLERYEDLLEIRAPASGTVILPSQIHKQHGTNERLSAWTGTPLAAANRGCHLEAGTLLCRIGDANRLEAVALGDQADMDLIQLGQRVKIRLEQQPWQSLWGTVDQISRIDLAVAPRTLVSTGNIPIRQEETGAARPLATAYQIRITLDESDLRRLANAPGHGKISVAPQSLGQRLLRFCSRNFGSRS